MDIREFRNERVNIDPLILFKSSVPDPILKQSNCQLGETLRAWNVFRESWKHSWTYIIHTPQTVCGLMEISVWNVKKLKTLCGRRRVLFCFVKDIIIHNRFKEFFEFVLEYDNPIYDKCKYNVLLKANSLSWLDIQGAEDIFYTSLRNLIDTTKVPRYSYG